MTTPAHAGAPGSGRPPHTPASPRVDPYSATPNIADRYADLITSLSPRRRRGLIALLAQGYFDDWRPSRDEVAALIAQELRKSPR